MRNMIELKKMLLRFYSAFDTYFAAALKFGIAFYTLHCICDLGYMKPMAQLPILLIIAAFCSFLSPNILLMAGVVYLGGQYYGHSPETAIVGGIVLILFLLLYFSFIPGQAYIVILTALGIGWRLPLLVPVIGGLLLGPGAAVGIACGTAVYYMTVFLVQRTPAEVKLGEALFRNVLELLQRWFLQQELVLTLVILIAVFFVVYLIRRLPVKYSWSIAILAGLLVYGILSGMEMMMLHGKVTVAELAVNLGVAGIAAGLVQFFAFGVDYKRVQYLQFEDDDYYYYVKAVSKFDKPEEEEDYYFD